MVPSCVERRSYRFIFIAFSLGHLEVSCLKKVVFFKLFHHIFFLFISSQFHSSFDTLSKQRGTALKPAKCVCRDPKCAPISGRPCWCTIEEVSKVLPSLTTQERDSALRPEIAAHVTGGSFDNVASPGSPLKGKVLGQKIPAWESARGLAFLHNMELRNGELIIPQAGLYYIYSQTYFRQSQPEEGDDGGDEQENEPSDKQMLQYIYKKVSSYPAPILLMKNARTTCWSKDAEYGLYSIYQAGVVQLGIGDRLFVTVSNLSTVDMDEKSSFFGAFLVS